MYSVPLISSTISSMMLKCLQDEILVNFKELGVENGMSVYIKYLIELRCNSKVYAVSLLIFYFLINKGDPVIIYPFQLSKKKMFYVICTVDT